MTGIWNVDNSTRSSALPTTTDLYNCSYPAESKEDATYCLSERGDILRYTSQQAKNVILGVQLLFTVAILVTNIIAITLYVVDKTLHTSYNLHILSVLVADMCAGLFAVPCAMLIHAPRIQGDEMCKAFAFFLSLIEAADVYTMVLIAAEKYLRLVFKPTLQRGLLQTALYISLVWTASFLYSLKDIYAYESYIETHWDGHKLLYHTECWIPPSRTSLVKTYVIIDALLLFCLPLVAICMCYASITKSLTAHSIQDSGIAQKKRAVRLHMTVVAMFFFTACGLHILRIYLTFGGKPFPYDSLCNDILTTIAFSDFWINPLLYCFFNTNFRSSWAHLCGGSTIGNGTATVTPLESVVTPTLRQNETTVKHAETSRIYTIKCEPENS